MRIRVATALILFPLLMCVANAATPRVILIQVTQPTIPWSESRLVNKLETQFSRDSRLRTNVVQFPEKVILSGGTDSLIALGKEQKGNLLLALTILSERIDRRKGFQLPLIFHKWETVGIVEGEFRLIDLLKGKVLAAEPFTHELNGPRIFQASTDDNCDDPDIHLRAPDKALFFSKLEDGLVTKLVARTRTLIGTAWSHDRESFAQKIKE